MIQSPEFRSSLRIKIPNGVISTTDKVWDILVASRNGDVENIRAMIAQTPELLYAQYNYTPPIHFAVREGHEELVKFLLDQGALDPSYKIYPFQESLVTIAEDRGYDTIADMLKEYNSDPSKVKYKGDNGEILYDRDEAHATFQKAVDKGDMETTQNMLRDYPGIINDETYFWGEGLLMMPSKDGNKKMVELLLDHGATVPRMSKWARFYYFKHYEIAHLLMERGMSAQHLTWHRVTLLHDMAQEGDLQKVTLLVKHGAMLDVIDEEYQSTPLGLAAKWGREDIVKYLLAEGADPNASGAVWSTPLAWAQKKSFPNIERILQQNGAEE